MDFSTITAIPAIAIICFFVSQAYKAFVKDESMNKHIPVICGAVGLILGVVCFVLIPGWIPAENVVVAAATGLVSGWSATGVHQVYKQYFGGE